MLACAAVEGDAKAQEKSTGAVPSFYGGSSATGSKLAEQAAVVEAHRTLAGSIKVNDSLARDLSRASEVVANPATGEVRVVTAAQPIPAGWVRLVVQNATNGGVSLVSRDVDASGKPFVHLVQPPTALANKTTAPAPSAAAPATVAAVAPVRPTTGTAAPDKAPAPAAPPADAQNQPPGYRPPLATQGAFAGAPPPGPGPAPPPGSGPPPTPPGGGAPPPGSGPPPTEILPADDAAAAEAAEAEALRQYELEQAAKGGAPPPEVKPSAAPPGTGVQIASPPPVEVPLGYPAPAKPVIQPVDDPPPQVDEGEPAGEPSTPPGTGVQIAIPAPVEVPRGYPAPAKLPTTFDDPPPEAQPPPSPPGTGVQIAIPAPVEVPRGYPAPAKPPVTFDDPPAEEQPPSPSGTGVQIAIPAPVEVPRGYPAPSGPVVTGSPPPAEPGNQPRPGRPSGTSGRGGDNATSPEGTRPTPYRPPIARPGMPTGASPPPKPPVEPAGRPPETPPPLPSGPPVASSSPPPAAASSPSPPAPRGGCAPPRAGSGSAVGVQPRDDTPRDGGSPRDGAEGAKEADDQRLDALRRAQQRLGGTGAAQQGGRSGGYEDGRDQGRMSAAHRAEAARVESQSRAQQAIQSGIPASGSGGMRGAAKQQVDATPAVREQIGRLSQALAAEAPGAAQVAQAAAATAGCPPELANACDAAAAAAAAEAQKKIDEAAERDRQKAEKELEKKERENKKKLDRLKREEEKRKKRQARRDRMEREQRERAERLQDEADRLKERGEKLADERKRLEQEERDLRRREQEARRNDPNCRSAECRAIQDQRRANSRATTDLARNEGRFQADQARFQGQVQAWQRDQDQLDRLMQGDPVYETRKAQAQAHQRVSDTQAELDRLKEEQQRLRERGGSNSAEDRAYDRAIDAMERQLADAMGNARQADNLALKAQFYANGMGDQWKEFEKTQSAANAFNAAVDANARVEQSEAAYNKAQADLDMARRSGNFSPESIARMERELADARQQLETARADQKAASGAATAALKGLYGGPVQSVSDANARRLSESLSGYSNELAERQRLSQASDAELAAERGVLQEAQGRIQAAKQALAGSGAPDPGGPNTKRYAELEQRREQLQGQIDNFQPGNNPGAADAYRGMQEQLKQIDAELKTLAPIGEANAAFDRVGGHRAYVDSLTAGFPVSAPGKIDQAAFAADVRGVAQAQVDLVEGNAELAAANRAAANVQSRGEKQAASDAQTQVRTATDKVSDATAALAGEGINVAPKPGGGFGVTVETYGAAMKWQAGAQAVDNYVATANRAPPQGAPPAPMQKPSDAARPAQPPAPPADGEKPAEGTTAVRNPSGVDKAAVVGTGEPPGGPANHLQKSAGEIANQADGMNPPPRNPTAAAPKPTPEQLRQQADAAKREAEETRRAADAAQREADQAREAAERERAEADRQKAAADANVGTQTRQARDYAELADSAKGQGDEFRRQADELDAKAKALRDQAARYDRAAVGSGGDQTLAANALEAARNNREDAARLEREADAKREDAAREDALADERSGQSEGLKDDAGKLDARARDADEKADKAEAEAAEKQAEADRLAADAELDKQRAGSQTEVARQARTEAVNAFLDNPPPGWDWESMTSDERGAWLANNIPDWDKMKSNEKADVLRRMELADARADYVDAQERKDEFDASPQGQRTTSGEIRRRVAELEAKQKELKELKEAEGGTGILAPSKIIDAAVTTDREKRIAQLEQEIADEAFKLRNDINARMGAETEFADAVREANRAYWQVDPEARAEEVTSRVAGLANAKAQLDIARDTQSARADAFNRREAELKQQIASGSNVKEAKEQLAKLNEARAFYAENDRRNVEAAQRLYEDAKHDVALESAKDGLGEIAFEENLGARVDQFVKDNPGPLQQAREGQIAAVRQGVAALDLTADELTLSGAVVGAYDAATGFASDVAVANVAGAGFVYGVGKGLVNTAVGLLDFLSSAEDALLETLETGLTGQSRVFGTESLESVNALLGQSPGDLAVGLAVDLGRRASNGLDQLGRARESGSLTDAFAGASKTGEVYGELLGNVLDPVEGAVLATTASKASRVAKAVDGVSAAGVASDAARASNLASDAAQLGAKADAAAASAGRLASNVPPSAAGGRTIAGRTPEMPPAAGRAPEAAPSGTTRAADAPPSGVSGGTEVIAGRLGEGGRLKPTVDSAPTGPGPTGTERITPEGVDFGGQKPKLGDVVDMAPLDDSPPLPPPANPAPDLSLTPPGSLSKNLTPAQIDDLFTPGRNLTPDEIIQKADLIRAKKVPLAAVQGDPAVLRALDETFGIKANRPDVASGGTIIDANAPVRVGGGQQAPPMAGAAMSPAASPPRAAGGAVTGTPGAAPPRAAGAAANQAAPPGGAAAPAGVAVAAPPPKGGAPATGGAGGSPPPPPTRPVAAPPSTPEPQGPFVGRRDGPEIHIRETYGKDGEGYARAYEIAEEALGQEAIGVAGSVAGGTARTQKWPPGITTGDDAYKLTKVPTELTPAQVERLPPDVRRMHDLRKSMDDVPSDIDVVTTVQDQAKLDALRNRIFKETGVLVEFVDPLPGRIEAGNTLILDSPGPGSAGAAMAPSPAPSAPGGNPGVAVRPAAEPPSSPAGGTASMSSARDAASLRSPSPPPARGTPQLATKADDAVGVMVLDEPAPAPAPSTSGASSGGGGRPPTVVAAGGAPPPPPSGRPGLHHADPLPLGGTPPTMPQAMPPRLPAKAEAIVADATKPATSGANPAARPTAAASPGGPTGMPPARTAADGGSPSARPGMHHAEPIPLGGVDKSRSDPSRPPPPNVDEVSDLDSLDGSDVQPVDNVRRAPDYLLPLERDSIQRLNAQIETLERRQNVLIRTGDLKRADDLAVQIADARARISNWQAPAADARRAATAAARAESAPVFNVPQQAGSTGRPPRAMRHMAPGDIQYLTEIMGQPVPSPVDVAGGGRTTRIVGSGQDHVIVETINSHVQRMLNGEPLPPPRGGPPRILLTMTESGILVADGNHRIVAAEIVSRMTGRPIFEIPGVPNTTGLPPIIRADEIYWGDFFQGERALPVTNVGEIPEGLDRLLPTFSSRPWSQVTPRAAPVE